MDTKAIIAKNIRTAREASGLTQKQVAKELGLASHSNVSAMESGERRVSTTELVTLSKLFDKNIEWFFDPNSSKEDFVVLARAQECDEEVKKDLQAASRLVENFLFLKKILRS